MQEIYDEPFADSSQIPTILVSKLAKNKVTVALSGDGADELFGGYNRYIFTEKVWNSLNKVPFSLRRVGSVFLENIPKSLIESFLNTSNNFLPRKYKFAYPMSKFTKLTDILKSKSDIETYYRLISYWSFSPPIKNFGNFDFYRYLSTTFKRSDKYSFLEEMMINDLKFILLIFFRKLIEPQCHILLKLGLLSLIINCRVFIFPPTNMKIRNGESKWILKNY